MRPDRVLFPKNGFTKKDAIDYYTRVAKVMLPHLKNVPVSFLRFPDTIEGESFWEKNLPPFAPAFIKTTPVPRRDGSDINYIVINDRRTLAWIADVGGIEIHPFLHRAPKIDVATSVVFDLDPGEGTTFADCCRVAILLRDALDHIGLKSFAKVSGSKGLQIYVPLNTRGVTHDATEIFAKLVAEELARAMPKLVVAKMAKQLRANHVFIDWSQNADYKTTVAVYSLRAKRSTPFVSMPVTWDEVRKANAPDFTPDAALKRIAERGDLFAPVLKLKQKLPIKAASEAPAPLRRETTKRTQSGRRLFLIVKTEQAGDELWLDMHDKFSRWILRPDREHAKRLIAMPAGTFDIEDEYRRGQVPPRWKKTVTIEERGEYELIEGSYARHRFDLWFTGRALQNEWTLEKIDESDEHRSWSLSPI